MVFMLSSEMYLVCIVILNPCSAITRSNSRRTSHAGDLFSFFLFFLKKIENVDCASGLTALVWDLSSDLATLKTSAP